MWAAQLTFLSCGDFFFFIHSAFPYNRPDSLSADYATDMKSSDDSVSLMLSLTLSHPSPLLPPFRRGNHANAIKGKLTKDKALGLHMSSVWNRHCPLPASFVTVVHVLRVVVFIRNQTAVLHCCLCCVWFNKHHMVLLACPHSWHTDHHQYLQGSQCDLSRWESSRQRYTT